jgi:tetratricopeptide (TPR) repeat protein
MRIRTPAAASIGLLSLLATGCSSFLYHPGEQPASGAPAGAIAGERDPAGDPAPEVPGPSEKPAPRAATKAPPEEPAVAAAPDTQAPPVTETQGIAQLYEEGVAALKAGNFDAGLRDLETVWRADPRYADVADRIKTEYQVRGLEAYSSRRLEYAIQLWERALEIDPQDNKTIAYLSHAREQLKKPEAPGGSP